MVGGGIQGTVHLHHVDQRVSAVTAARSLPGDTRQPVRLTPDFVGQIRGVVPLRVELSITQTEQSHLRSGGRHVSHVANTTGSVRSVTKTLPPPGWKLKLEKPNIVNLLHLTERVTVKPGR